MVGFKSIFLVREYYCDMLINLGWRSLEYCLYDSRLAMFYKIQYGLVAVQMPSYFNVPRESLATAVPGHFGP